MRNYVPVRQRVSKLTQFLALFFFLTYTYAPAADKVSLTVGAAQFTCNLCRQGREREKQELSEEIN